MAFERPANDLTEHDNALLEAHPRLLRIQEWLCKYGIRDLTLGKAAELACLERHYFSTVFRKHMNVNFSDWVREQRMQLAATLLHRGFRNIDQVHQDVGFHNRRTFERIFQRRYGLTPARFARCARGHRIRSLQATLLFGNAQPAGKAEQ